LNELCGKTSEEEIAYTKRIMACHIVYIETKDFLEFPHLYKNLLKAYLKDKRKSEN
jgi:hypothetical protein